MFEQACFLPHFGQTKSSAEKVSQAWVKSNKSEVLLNMDLRKASKNRIISISFRFLSVLRNRMGVREETVLWSVLIVSSLFLLQKNNN